MSKYKCECTVTAKGLKITCDDCLQKKYAAAQRKEAKFKAYWENNANAYNAVEYFAAKQLVKRLAKRIIKK